MILFLIYAVVMAVMIWKNGFFGLFRDEAVTKKQYSLFFIGKILAVPVLLFVYDKTYGGISQWDAGKFHHDVVVISDLLKSDRGLFFRMMFGFADEQRGSADHTFALVHTYNWDNGTLKDYFYNDNRVLIRLHVLLNFLAFDKYAVHALFSCFLSFIGFHYLYKTLKEWFNGKELVLFFILCFFPALWFYTGGLLKEGPTIFVLGAALFCLKKIISTGLNWRLGLSFGILLLFSILLKPYFLLLSLLSFGLFFTLNKFIAIKRKIPIFFSLIFLAFICLNLISIAVKGKSLSEAALRQNTLFTGISKGGIFLEDSLRFIRLPNDTNLVKQLSANPAYFTIKKDAAFMYWKTEFSNDTLYCNANEDTLAEYELAYIIPESHSNVQIYHPNNLKMLVACYYYTLFYPSFFNASGPLQWLAALENLLIIAAFLIVVKGLFQNRKNHFLPMILLFITLATCLLIGITSPNSGAIFRYRAPAMIFLLLAALYYFDLRKATTFNSKSGN